MKRYLIGAIAALFACAVLMPVLSGAAGDTSFARDIQPIFDTQCVVCHTADDPHGALPLERGLARAVLVNVPAAQAPKLMRVAPGKPQRSYLVKKIEGTHLAAGGSGWQMPPPTHPMIKLSSHDKQLIIRWIADGARDN